MEGNGKVLKTLPFGAQYYRAPTPEASEWKSDLVCMRSAGFNTIKIWAQWRWNQPDEDRFYWDDLDALMDLAHETGLSVVINTILDCAPAWLYRKYADCVMVNPCGRPVGPVTLGHRQIGGAPGPCFHHPGAMAHLEHFVEEVVKRYARHPALEVWDLWNEPELTVGLMREPKVENLVCYCENSRIAFVQWLKNTYGTIERLNDVWHRNYRDWDELELPIQPLAYNDMVDWRTFFVQTITENMERRAEIARANDPAHPVMCHTVPPPHFNPITCGSDDWQLARCCDLFGNSVGSDPMPADIMRSAARGKTVINAEIHAIPGSTFCRPMPIGLEEMKRHILVPLAHGIKGFLFWQYRPELLGGESPAWGLTFPDGRPAPWMEAAGRICRELLDESEFFLNAEREKPQVAVFVSPANQIFCWAAASGTRLHDASIAGTYNALYRANYSVDFVHPTDVLSGVLEEHSVLYMPIPYWVERDVLEKIREWVRSGGNLISECFFAGMDVERGYHSKVTPGAGFDEVFGVQEGITYPESGMFDSYSWQAQDGDGGISFRLVSDIGSLSAGTVCAGYQSGMSLVGSGAQVLAEFPTGEAAVTSSSYGEGSAVMIGTLLGAACKEKQSDASAAFLSELVGRHARGKRPLASPEGRVRVDVLSHGERRWIMLQNLTDDRLQASVELPGKSGGSFVEMFSGCRCNALDVELGPRQIRAFWHSE